MAQKDPFGKENLSDAEKKFLASGQGFKIKMSFNLNQGQKSPSVQWDIEGLPPSPDAPKEEADKLGKACLIIGDGLRRALGPGGVISEPNADFFKQEEAENLQAEKVRSRIKLPPAALPDAEEDLPTTRPKKKTKPGQRRTESQ